MRDESTAMGSIGQDAVALAGVEDVGESVVFDGGVLHG
jgi:hypothetical protein